MMHAAKATDALRAVRSLIKANINRTNQTTGTTLCTVIRINFQPNQAVPIEQGIKGPKWTQGATEKSAEYDARENNEDENKQFEQEEPPGQLAQ